MKFLIFILVVLSLVSNVFGLDRVHVKNKTKKKVKVVKAIAPVVPCDSKEDILKKLEEKKKAEESKEKAFSLQGGDTGCKLK